MAASVVKFTGDDLYEWIAHFKLQKLSDFIQSEEESQRFGHVLRLGDLAGIYCNRELMLRLKSKLQPLVFKRFLTARTLTTCFEHLPDVLADGFASSSSYQSISRDNAPWASSSSSSIGDLAMRGGAIDVPVTNLADPMQLEREQILNDVARSITVHSSKVARNAVLRVEIQQLRAVQTVLLAQFSSTELNSEFETQSYEIDSLRRQIARLLPPSRDLDAHSLDIQQPIHKYSILPPPPAAPAAPAAAIEDAETMTITTTTQAVARCLEALDRVENIPELAGLFQEVLYMQYSSGSQNSSSGSSSSSTGRIHPKHGKNGKKTLENVSRCYQFSLSVSQDRAVTVKVAQALSSLCLTSSALQEIAEWELCIPVNPTRTTTAAGEQEEEGSERVQQQKIHFVSAFIDMITARWQGDLDVAESGVRALRMLCRFGEGVETQVAVTTNQIAMKRGLCEQVVWLLERWGAESAPLASEGLLLCACIATDHTRLFSHTRICEVCLDLMEHFLSPSKKNNNNNTISSAILASGACFCLRNLTRLMQPDMVRTLHALDGKNKIKALLVDNPLITQSRTRSIAETILLSLKTASLLVKRAYQFSAAVFPTVKPTTTTTATTTATTAAGAGAGASATTTSIVGNSAHSLELVSEMQKITQLISSAEEQVELLGVPNFLSALLCLLQRYTSASTHAVNVVNVLVAGICLLTKLCRYGVDIDTQNEWVTQRVNEAGAQAIIVYVLNTHGKKSELLANSGLRCVAVLAAKGQHVHFNNPACSRLLETLVDLLINYIPISPTTKHPSPSLCLTPITLELALHLTMAIYNLTISKTAWMLRKLREVDAGKVIKERVLNNKNFQGRTREGMTEVVLRLK